MSKLFPKKKEKSPVKEETKVAPESSKSTSKPAGLQSRLMTFFTKKTKSKEQPQKPDEAAAIEAEETKETAILEAPAAE